eukprot:256971-Pleurochrysis_carterae.AAC.1
MDEGEKEGEERRRRRGAEEESGERGRGREGVKEREGERRREKEREGKSERRNANVVAAQESVVRRRSGDGRASARLRTGCVVDMIEGRPAHTCEAQGAKRPR